MSLEGCCYEKHIHSISGAQGKDLLDYILAKLPYSESCKKYPSYFRPRIASNSLKVTFTAWKLLFFSQLPRYQWNTQQILGQQFIPLGPTIWTMNPTGSCWLSLVLYQYHFFQVWVPPKIQWFSWCITIHPGPRAQPHISLGSPIGGVLFDRFSHHVYSRWCFWEGFTCWITNGWRAKLSIRSLKAQGVERVNSLQQCANVPFLESTKQLSNLDNKIPCWRDQTIANATVSLCDLLLIVACFGDGKIDSSKLT